MAEQFLAQRLARLEAVLERDERLHHLAGSRIRNADHADLGDCRMLHQRAFHLERTDEMTRALDDVVRATDKPIIALGVAHGEIAGEIPAASETFAIALFLVEITAHHRGPAGTQRQLADDHRLRDFPDLAAFARARLSRPSTPGSGRPMDPGLTSIDR